MLLLHSKIQKHSTWVTFSGMTVITSSMKVQNLQAGEEYGPCGNSICFIIFFFNFRKEHWKKKKEHFDLWVKCY